ncbi:beta-phosphoglucomutase [Aureibacter tunicatorum]|uniref:Beta-phosphoglucomutase n=1 Tax=Aureibacter tunicatorum TaxID=866807 RepID=A0AAE3XLL9_9BACT|nr:beta-phosphoglucomutase [Aureibacter tunicatorum]MDR6238702.1 beta-phosphoglucomutase [Aureibacter tunicatorum]BDD05367.1 beta-phosphoglucomutase [Aureibacter tunicatorum]
MDIKACLFDLDGVLVDTAKYHYLAWKRLANEMGFDFTEQDNERLKGVSRVRSLEILLEIGGKELTDKEKELAAYRKNEWYVEYVDAMGADEVLDGVIPFLEELKSKNILIGLGSASKNAQKILEKVKIDRIFDVVIDGNMVSKAKPDPEVFLNGAIALGVEPQNCVVFEDAEAGVEAARRAGMRSVGIGEPETLRLADIVLPSMAKVSLDMLVDIGQEA